MLSNVLFVHKGVFTRNVFQPVVNNAAFFNYHCVYGDDVKKAQNGSATHCVCFCNRKTLRY